MKVTVDFPDPVYRRLKARAASHDNTVRELILRGVDHVLQESPRKSSRRVKLPLVRSKSPGTLHLDNAKIYDAIFSGNVETRLAEGLGDIREGRVHGPFRSASALIRSLHRTKKTKPSR